MANVQISQNRGYYPVSSYNYILIWMVLVWPIAGVLPNSPNFPTIRYAFAFVPPVYISHMAVLLKLHAYIVLYYCSGARPPARANFFFGQTSDLENFQ